MSSTPPNTPPPVRYPGSSAHVGHRLRPVAVAATIIGIIFVAAAVTAAIVLSGVTNPPEPSRPALDGHAPAAAPAAARGGPEPVAPERFSHPSAGKWGVAIALTSAGAINIANGISLTPAPGWTLTNRGPNWITLYNADSTARIQVEVKTAGGPDILAELQADINRLTSTPTTGLTNVTNLSGPTTKALHSANFQQQASIDYTADISTQQGIIPVLGVFDELLNTSNLLSAFIDYRQDGNASTHSAGSGGMMIKSML